MFCDNKHKTYKTDSCENFYKKDFVFIKTQWQQKETYIKSLFSEKTVNYQIHVSLSNWHWESVMRN